MRQAIVGGSTSVTVELSAWSVWRAWLTLWNPAISKFVYP